MRKLLKKRIYYYGNLPKAVGSLVDILPANGYRVHINRQSDLELIRSDWEAVGSYISKAKKKFDEESCTSDSRQRLESGTNQGGCVGV